MSVRAILVTLAAVSFCESIALCHKRKTQFAKGPAAIGGAQSGAHIRETSGTDMPSH